MYIDYNSSYFFRNAIHINHILFNSKKLYCTNCNVTREMIYINHENTDVE